MKRRDPNKANQIEWFVNSYFEKHLHTPSLREIENGVGFSRQTIHRYLVEMNTSGRLQYCDGRITTSYMESEFSHTVSLPLLAGSISCGAPKMEEGWCGHDISCLIDRHSGDNTYYALYASGDSMKDAGIEPGDYIIVRKTNVANIGQIVVALTDHHESTLKRLTYNETLCRPVLHPENNAYNDIAPNVIEIQGVAVCVIKSLK